MHRGNGIRSATLPSGVICKRLNYMPVQRLALTLAMTVHTAAGRLRFIVWWVVLPASLGESVLAFGDVIPSSTISRYGIFSDGTDTSPNTCFIDQH